MTDKSTLLELTADIVAAYAANNPLTPDAMPDFISSVFKTLDELERAVDENAEPALIPAVPIDESITDDYLICLEDGKPFKSLKRHLRSKFELSPEAYREKWNLPVDYPMVAPSYAKERSQLAKKMGLGRSEG